jgi:hypothetical protein
MPTGANPPNLVTLLATGKEEKLSWSLVSFETVLDRPCRKETFVQFRKLIKLVNRCAKPMNNTFTN